MQDFSERSILTDGMLESQTDLLNIKDFFMQDQRIKPSSGGKPIWVEGLAIGDSDNDVPIYESDKDDDNEDAMPLLPQRSHSISSNASLFIPSQRWKSNW